jgi:membrane fusion protein (multidrug efflux system)
MKPILPLLACVAMAIPAAAQPPGGPPPPPHVQVLEVQPATQPVNYEFNGVIEASRTVEIRSRVPGFILSREFEEGAMVKEGDVLFTIEPESFEADVEVAAARVEQAQSRLKLAQQEVKRLESVKEPGAIARSDLDTRLAEQTNAAAALRLAEAEYAKAKLELGYTKVTAPMTGYVGKSLKENGSYVDAGQNSLLVMLWKVDPIYVSFSMSEREFLEWRGLVESGALVASGEQMVEITLLNGTVYPERGALDFQSAVINEFTGSVELRATLSNADMDLKPGQFVKASIVGWARPNSIAVPQRAVSQSPQGAFVYVVDAENKAQMRHIVPGGWNGTSWIVEKGLAAGDKVVVEGLVKVQPGIEVVPSPWNPDASAAEAQSADAPAEQSK